MATSAIVWSGHLGDHSLFNSASVKIIGELVVFHIDCNTVIWLAPHHPAQKLTRNFRQHGVGQDGVDHATTTFDFLTAIYN